MINTHKLTNNINKMIKEMENILPKNNRFQIVNNLMHLSFDENKRTKELIQETAFLLTHDSMYKDNFIILTHAELNFIISELLKYTCDSSMDVGDTVYLILSNDGCHYEMHTGIINEISKNKDGKTLFKVLPTETDSLYNPEETQDYLFSDKNIDVNVFFYEELAKDRLKSFNDVTKIMSDISNTDNTN